MKKLILLDIVGLTKNDLDIHKPKNLLNIFDTGFVTNMKPSFPAVTCSVQATLFSGYNPSDHGIIANGFYDEKFKQIKFWEQTSYLVEKPRIWDILKNPNPSIKTAILFFQNSLFANSDIVVTPKPIHLDDKMIMWCYSKPVDLYDNLINSIHEFDLKSYWGPLASIKSSQWIYEATKFTIKQYEPNLLLVYLPHLDYSAQKYGPNSLEFSKSVRELDEIIGDLLNFLEDYEDYQIIVTSEYGFHSVSKSVSPNILLKNAGFLKTRKIDEKEYVDYELSNAFAMVDHQIAHIYTKQGYENDVQTIFKQNDGISTILDKQSQKNLHINHHKSGQLILCADSDTWFNYYWWNDLKKAPDFTFNVDIHRKPGFDPLELFLDKKLMQISHDTSLIKGSHGIIDSNPENFPLFGSIISKNVNDTIQMTQIAPTILKFFNCFKEHLDKPVF